MALEQKEQQRAEGTPEQQVTQRATFDQGPLLIPDLGLQRLATETALADFDTAQTERDNRHYGKTSKGETLQFDKWLQELKDLYFGHRDPKTVPWQYCSNRSLMIAMAIIETLHARLLPGVYHEDLTRWRPMETTDVERAERIEKLMTWWIRVHNPLREFFDRWVRTAIGFGQVTAVTRWDVQLQDRGERTPPDAQMNPDGTVTIQPSEKVLDRIETTQSEVIPTEDVFFLPGATNVQRDTILIKRRYLYRDLADLEQEGKVANVTQPTVPGQPTLRELTVVPSAAGQGVTPEQQQSLEDVRRRNVPIDCLEWHGTFDFDGDGFAEQVRLLCVPQHRLYLGALPISALSRRGLRHLDHTLFLPRLDEPNGLWGLGVLEQIKELALEIDAIFNQLTDANSLSVLRPGFYDPHGDLDPGALSLAPNKWIPVPRPSENVYIPDMQIQTDRLLNAVRLVLEFIERLTAASAYVMGKESEIVGGSGTATRTEAIVGAAGQRHAIPVARLREGAARILTQHLDLVQTNLPPGLESRLLGTKGEPVFEANELTQESVASDMDAYLLPDESLGSRETERQLAQMLYTTLIQNLIVASDPSKIYKITADFLKAYGKDPEAYLGVAPDVKQTDRPEDENTYILQGQFASVKASVLDNHLEHMLSHQAMLQDPGFQTLPEALKAQVTQFLMGHIQEHMQLMQMLMQAAQQAKGGGGDANGSGNGQSGRNGQKRGPGPAAPVGPEPGVGSVQQPRAAAAQTQRTGTGQPPAGGGA